MTRGRPPTYCEVINNEKYVTTETLDREVERLEKHRTDCRNRYRLKRDMLKRLRPDLFNKVNGCSTNRNVIRELGIPLSSILLQSPEEERIPSPVEGRAGFHEITLREAINWPKTEV